MPIKIEVTQERINKGERQCGESCPIALALASVVGGDVYVDGDVMRWTDEQDRAMIAGTPSIANAFIEAFDENLPVSPISFDIEGRLEDDE